MTYDELMGWARKHDLRTNPQIAAVIRVSPQTIRNWSVRRRVPSWVRYACVAIDNNCDPIDLSVSAIKAWQSRTGLRTYEDTGRVFDLKRQTVHQWFRRCSFPRWLALACAGYDFEKSSINADLSREGHLAFQKDKQS